MPKICHFRDVPSRTSADLGAQADNGGSAPASKELDMINIYSWIGPCRLDILLLGLKLAGYYFFVTFLEQIIEFYLHVIEKGQWQL